MLGGVYVLTAAGTLMLIFSWCVIAAPGGSPYWLLSAGTAAHLANSSVLQELLKSNMQQNLQLVVQVAKEYTEQLGAGKIIELLENNKTYHGLYYYLGSYIAFSEDSEVHFK